MEAARRLSDDPDRAQARLAHLSVAERAQGDSEEFDSVPPAPERAEYSPRTSLAEDPALNSPRVSAALRNNIRFAERALALGKPYFRVMPDPESGPLDVETVDPELFLQRAILLRDAEQEFIGVHGVAEPEDYVLRIQKDHRVDRAREILKERRQPAVHPASTRREFFKDMSPLGSH